MLTLSLGVRYDYQDEVPLTKNAFAPRLGMAFAPNERTLIRAGVGKFYQYQSTAIPANLFAGAVNAPVFTFDTGQDNNPVGRTAADERRLPAAGEQWRPGGDQPRVPGAAGGASHLGERGRLREHRAGARRQSPPAISVVLRRRGPARNLDGNGA